VGASLLAVLVVSVLLAAVARHYDVSAPLALVLAGLLAGLIPGFKQIELNPSLVLYVLLPPLLWSAGLESSYVALRRNIRQLGHGLVGHIADRERRRQRQANRKQPDRPDVAPQRHIAAFQACGPQQRRKQHIQHQ
jgi:hypothetical protein